MLASIADYIGLYLVCLLGIMMVFGTPIFIGYGIKAFIRYAKYGQNFTPREKTEHTIMIILGFIFIVLFMMTGII
jgi:hypothetical protein